MDLGTNVQKREHADFKFTKPFVKQPPFTNAYGIVFLSGLGRVIHLMEHI
jgi:hypothetical protein